MAGFDRSSARQWSRTAWAVAAVFASLPVVGRLLLGTWGFEDAWGVACGLGILGAYLHTVGRRRHRTVPDASATLERAIRLATAGRIDQAIELLTKVHRQSPRLWQALQYRGELHLARHRTDLALEDFDAAIRLASEEPHLVHLRELALAEAAAPPEGDSGPRITPADGFAVQDDGSGKESRD